MITFPNTQKKTILFRELELQLQDWNIDVDLVY